MKDNDLPLCLSRYFGRRLKGKRRSWCESWAVTRQMSSFPNQIPSSREGQFQEIELLLPVLDNWEVLQFSEGLALKMDVLKAHSSTVFVGGAE